MLILFTFFGNNLTALRFEEREMAYDKNAFLDQIIQEYLRVREPIGSEMLKNSLKLDISSATIRNYFKALMQDGVLIQSHTSSGRIPTEMALKSYWRSRLCFECSINLKALSQAATEFGLFVLVREQDGNILESVARVENEFLILHFSQDHVLLAYQPKMEKFLNQLIGLELMEIKKIAHQVMANELFEKLDWLSYRHIQHFGLSALAPLLEQASYEDLFFELLNGQILDKVSLGIFFDPVLPLGFMGVVQNIKYAKKPMQMLTIGPLVSDYEGFYERLAA